jgi:hypothetical protein
MGQIGKELGRLAGGVLGKYVGQTFFKHNKNADSLTVGNVGFKVYYVTGTHRWE